VNEIDNSLEIQKLLQQQLGSGGDHKVWLKNRGKLKLFPALLKKVDLVTKSLSFEIPQDAKDDPSFALIKGIEAKVFLQGVNLTFFSEILTYEKSEGILRLLIPEVAYFAERRTEERARPSGTAKIKLPAHGSFSHGLVKDILDLSIGGLSFILQKKDHFPYKAGEDLPQVLKVFIAGQELDLTAQVVQVLKIKPFVLENVPYGDRLVSLKFTSDNEIGQKRWQNLWESIQK
jgi:hypothetical protein